MNSHQRRKLLRLADRAQRGQSPSNRELAALPRNLSTRQKLALAEDLSLAIDSGEDMSNITKSTKESN